MLQEALAATRDEQPRRAPEERLRWNRVFLYVRPPMDLHPEGRQSIARVLRRLIEFTQAGGEVNIIVTGINVGAQPYWNSEATMLMHTRGILVMMPESATVPTGKTALDYSGKIVRSEKLGEIADEFDRVHTMQRALAVGSLDRIIPARDLRP